MPCGRLRPRAEAEPAASVARRPPNAGQPPPHAVPFTATAERRFVPAPRLKAAVARLLRGAGVGDTRSSCLWSLLRSGRLPILGLRDGGRFGLHLFDAGRLLLEGRRRRRWRRGRRRGRAGRRWAALPPLVARDLHRRRLLDHVVHLGHRGLELSIGECRSRERSVLDVRRRRRWLLFLHLLRRRLLRQFWLDVLVFLLALLRRWQMLWLQWRRCLRLHWRRQMLLLLQLRWQLLLVLLLILLPLLLLQLPQQQHLLLLVPFVLLARKRLEVGSRLLILLCPCPLLLAGALLLLLLLLQLLLRVLRVVLLLLQVLL
mmetsp:Transcript_1162/g.3195  ORF Transcript_1162/g.3195 Transcript_1162/m.3195 type:complete len:316 (-) Transcript_1162:53-1000(-)